MLAAFETNKISNAVMLPRKLCSFAKKSRRSIYPPIIVRRRGVPVQFGYYTTGNDYCKTR
jgi:hypothetical protein